MTPPDRPDPLDSFEQRLTAIPPREPPPELRARILAAAERPSFSTLLLSLAKFIFSFPHPLAWGAVAAAWITIAALNLSGPRGETLAVTPRESRTDHPFSPHEYLVQFDQHQRLLDALRADLDPSERRYVLRPQDL